MAKFSISITLFFVSFFIQAQKNPIKNLDWLVGTWKIASSQGIIQESWEMKNDSVLVGKSMFIKDGKEIPQETLTLVKEGNDVFYISTVIGQNNNLPVKFKVLFQRGTEFICENLTHDFPQRIAYRRIGQSLFASIEGKKNGKYGKQNFDFKGE